MPSADEAVHLIRLTDSDGCGIAVRVLGRAQPGILTGHDVLDAEIAVTTGATPDATFPVTLLPEDLEDWEETLTELEAGRATTWLDSGRTPSVAFGFAESGALSVSVHDAPSTGTTVTLRLTTPPPAWLTDQHGHLTRVRETYPQEVVETSPGAYEWRHGRRPATEPGTTG